MRVAVGTFVMVAAFSAFLDAAPVRVGRRGAGFEVHASSAPLAEVLAALSRESGVRVVYDGAPPTALVTVAFAAPNTGEAFLRLFEGLGFSYVVAVGPSGTGDQFVFVVTGRDSAAASTIRNGGGFDASYHAVAQPLRREERSPPPSDDGEPEVSASVVAAPPVVDAPDDAPMAAHPAIVEPQPAPAHDNRGQPADNPPAPNARKEKERD